MVFWNFSEVQDGFLVDFSNLKIFSSIQIETYNSDSGNLIVRLRARRLQPIIGILAICTRVHASNAGTKFLVVWFRCDEIIGWEQTVQKSSSETSGELFHERLEHSIVRKPSSRSLKKLWGFFDATRKQAFHYQWSRTRFYRSIYEIDLSKQRCGSNRGHRSPERF